MMNKFSLTGLRELFNTAFRFGVVGLSTIALYFLCLNLLHPVVAQTALLAAICYAITMAYNYLAQSLFTFKKTARDGGAFMRYLAMHAICMALNSAIMVLLVDWLGLALNLAQLFVTVLIAGLSFILSYFWVYPQQPMAPK